MKAACIWSRRREPISEVFTLSRVVWDCSLNYCGVRPHRKLNMERRPIAKKYCEGKVKRTLKRESKELEIVKREAKSTRWSLNGGRTGKTVYLLFRRPYSDLELSEDESEEEDKRLNSWDRPWVTKRSSGSWNARKEDLSGWLTPPNPIPFVGN